MWVDSATNKTKQMIPASKKGQRIKLILLIASIVFAAALIYINARGVAIFIAGFLSGGLSLMYLREILWNTHKLIKEGENG